MISTYKSLYQDSCLHLRFYDLDLFLSTRVYISVIRVVGYKVAYN